MQWLELSAEVDREAVESVSAVFAEHGHSGVLVEEPILATGDWGGWDTDTSKPVIVRTFLAVEPGSDEKRQKIEEALWHLSRIRNISPMTAKVLEEVDWAEAWKDHFDVHRVGTRTVIKPTWREFTPEPNDVVIELDPGMAFGTGLHPTTRLCLKALEDVIQPGQHVLDLGCGSGILAIGAVLLGATNVDAIDTDPVAVSAATANCQFNGVQDRVHVFEGAIDAANGPYDVTVANISGKIVIALADEFAALTRPGGVLIVSGFLDETEIDVAIAISAAGFTMTASNADADWRSIRAVRDQP